MQNKTNYILIAVTILTFLAVVQIGAKWTRAYERGYKEGMQRGRQDMLVDMSNIHTLYNLEGKTINISYVTFSNSAAFLVGSNSQINLRSCNFYGEVKTITY